MRHQFVETVTRLVDEDPKAVLMLGDIGVFAFRDLLERHPLRAYNIGILEQSTISTAAGLSIAGLYPIIHTIAPFLVERAYEQIKIDLCYQELGANLVSVGASYDYAGLGCTHHCPGDVSILNEIPEIEIIVPGHSIEFDKLFNQNYANGSTSYFRLSETTNEEYYEVEFGKNILIKEGGEEVVVIAVGPILEPVKIATKDLDLTIIYCTTVKPFDFSSIETFLDKKLIIVEPYYSSPLVTNILRKNNNLNTNISTIGVPNSFIKEYGRKSDIDKMLGLDPESIRKKIVEKMNA